MATTETNRSDAMGRFSVSFVATNHEDVVFARAGARPTEQVRRVQMTGVVDSGEARLVLPEQVVNQLGLRECGETMARFADGRGAKRKVVEEVELTMLGRRGVFTAVVEPGRTDALIGAMVLEELDLLVDCGHQKLVPRDPNTTITEVE